ncbi:MAG: quinolinate synthase NadA, partial [Coriobacteriales bacterium]|nr:quinolinate synthase NadA [Coriobacteriales bacterium]
MLTKELLDEFAELKRQHDAIVLAHYYVQPDAQDLADYVGDSYFLAQKAATLDCKTLVFAGVQFMAESAKLLSPDKRVFMPEPTADCPMAHMLRKETVDQAREQYGEDLAVACYVNSTNQMKAWSDVCVTSSNAQRIVERLPQNNVLFVPDLHLGHYIQQQVPSKNI